jgi:hypothetical protein
MAGRKSMEDEQSGAGADNDVGATVSVLRRTAPGSGHSRNAASTLGSDVQAKIGQHLRAMYDDVVRQGVPDRFMDLLAQLDRPDPNREADRGGEQRPASRPREEGSER